ncbi:scavenger receptor cysteine-rich domain-containing protein DMBT1-like [Glandiceps talaboti]
MRYKWSKTVCVVAILLSLLRQSTATVSVVRLANGESPDRGRVEVLVHGEWGTVCDDTFDDNAALVVCRQLGYSNGRADFHSKYGEGSGRIWLDDVSCTGSELSVLSCEHSEYGVNNCAHYEDVGVTCTGTQNDGDIRIRAGGVIGRGRVEVFHGGNWGTVCNDNFNEKEASVVCRQLGLRFGRVVSSPLPGSGSIWLDDVQCTGTETRLAQCRHRGWSEHNCVHSEDVVVSCTQVSCSMWRQAGYTSNGYYTIDPDGYNGDNSFTVYCDMTTRNGITILHHNQESRTHVRGYESALSFSADVVYNNGVSITQAIALIGRSDRCWQYLKYECYHSLITSNNVIYAAWYDRNGNVMSNWAGAPIGQNICSCGSDGTCANSKSTCNCDNNDYVWRQDDGTITEKDYLPVTKLAFGDTGESNEQGFYTLGPLRCEGIVAASCDERRHFGFTTSGDYTIDPDGFNSGVNPFVVYCNMSNNEAVTVLNHNRRMRGHVNGYDSVLSYSVSVQYDNGISVSQATALLQKSETCSQYIKYECYHSLINIGSTKYTAWYDRNGNIMTNWAGAPVGQRMCACGVTGSCSNGRSTCNCDNNDNVWRYDDGTITDKDYLPVTKLAFGDTGSGEEGYYTLGALLCYGHMNNGDIRLVNGNGDHRGRLEIYMNGWGTVCNHHFTDVDARVVCRQLEYIGGNVTATNVYGRGSGVILLDDVKCRGNENMLSECSHRGWGLNNCGHGQDVGITCDIPELSDIRLVNGNEVYEGRLEVYFNGEWGTVCDDEFEERDAIVVCRQLGYSDGEIQPQGSHGHGLGSIVLDNVDCHGHEMLLEKCGNRGFGNHNCGHDEDVGIHCKLPNNGDVRLHGGTDAYKGRLEIFNSVTEHWETVCADTIDDKATRVVCRQLGYRGGGEFSMGGTTFGQSPRFIAIDNVECTGQENRLTECRHNSGGTSCQNTQAVITCDVPEHGDVRLVDGSNAYEGRIEVYFKNDWMRICNVDNIAIEVVCKQLALGHPCIDKDRVLNVAHVSVAPLDVKCIGSETSLMKCNITEHGTSPSCASNEDVHVSCGIPQYTPEEGNLRLVNGTVMNEGRLEIYHNGKWGSVCDDYFNDRNVKVVCRQFGYLAGTFRNFAAYGEATGHIWLDDVKCTGLETMLSDCDHASWGSHDCTHHEDISVFCKLPDTPDIRLVAGNSSLEGRVEIFHSDEWGTICDDSFDDKDAKVVCRQLGLSGGTPKYRAYFGKGTNTVWLDEVDCTGEELKLSACDHGGWGDSNCDHTEDVGVICS